MGLIEEFNDYRSKMNDKILSGQNKTIKRIFNLDTNTFSDGKVDKKSKEMIGLACSMVLRCDDCVRYHLTVCHEVGMTKEEIEEVFSIATLIGGTIVIPHLRRAYEFWEELENQHD
ncbi:MAG: carboxymuconolactone decarboxylase family protein [Cyclobacteriaceae bacterium]